MKKILAPTDFSQAAQMAVETAINVAKTTEAELILLHIVDQPTVESYSVEDDVMHDEKWGDRRFTAQLIETSRRQLDKVAELARRAAVKVTQELRLGNPFHGIDAVINEMDIDLVVMGTEGHSALDKIFIGSNTEKVVRHARCPVLTIHRKPSAASFKNIVFATSMIEDEDKFSQVVKGIQKLFDATLHIVWINTPVSFQPDAIVKRAMQEYAKRLKLENYTLNVFNDRSTGSGIQQFAESINADLIAMATHGRTGLAHMLYGSVAEKVSTKARRPVLTSVIR